MKKFLAFFLAAAILSAHLAACTQTEAPSDETNSDTAVSLDRETLQETEAETELDTDTETESETESDSEPEPETETTGEVESETESGVAPDPENETKYDVYLDLDRHPEEPAEGEGMTIGGVDISEFSIVRSADMPEGQLTMLTMFAEQIKQVTGATLPVITDGQTAAHEIVIGTTNRENAALAQAVTEIKDDGYAIVVDGGNLYISATTGRGVVYGMSDFLENYMGVRLYTTDFIFHRNVGAIVLEEGMKDVFSPEFYARRTWIDNLVKTPLDNVIFIKNNSDGLKKAKVGDNYPIRANSNHTIDSLAGMKGSNPCPSDENVYQTVLANVIKKLEDNQLQNDIQVGQVDGSEPCRCARCKEICEPYGTENAAWFLFINRLADEVAARYPTRDVKIITYSYQFTHGVPGNGFTVSDNVIINFCFDKACYNHAFDDPNCPVNVPVVAEFKQWAALCRADNLYVYDYAYNCGEHLLPDPNLLVMWENFRLYTECGVNGILSEGITSNGGEFDHMRAYLRAKLVWNPLMSEEEYFSLMRQFAVDYYGDAAPFLIEYLKILSDGKRFFCTNMYTPAHVFYRMGNEEDDTETSQELFLRCETLFDEALALETLTEAEREHVEYTSLHLFFAHWKTYPKGDSEGKAQIYKRVYPLRQKFGL